MTELSCPIEHQIIFRLCFSTNHLQSNKITQDKWEVYGAIKINCEVSCIALALTVDKPYGQVVIIVDNKQSTICFWQFNQNILLLTIRSKVSAQRHWTCSDIQIIHYFSMASNYYSTCRTCMNAAGPYKSIYSLSPRESFPSFADMLSTFTKLDVSKIFQTFFLFYSDSLPVI